MNNGDLTKAARRRRRRQGNSKRGGLGAYLGIISAAFGVALLGMFASFGYTYAQVSESLPEVGQYNTDPLAQTSIVYDRDGEIVDELSGSQNRFVVPLDEINPTLQEAAVAIEDHRFYEHEGLDFEAIGRAAQQNIASMSIQEGGSTITQQLIKNTYIDQELRSVPSFQRKITEATLSWQYEQENSKEDILGQYLNTVYFGENAYGAESAARTYFNKNAADLELHESAMLAGIINLPGAYDPFNDPESAELRRNVVLDQMQNYGYINQQERDEAAAEGLDLERGRIETESDNDYFLNAVQRELGGEFGDEMVYEGGLQIYTTLDPELQGLASGSVADVVNPDAGDPSASLVSVESETGAVRAMVGGSDFEDVQFNLATQGQRQAGSSFKPFVLAEAINQGIDPDTNYISRDLSIDIENQEDPYEVGNYGDVERGRIGVDEAMAESDNTVFVQLAQDVGMENIVELTNRLGIESELDPFLSTALGGLRVGVNPLEMASAYSTFANEGEHMEPYLVTRVTRTDATGQEETLMENEPEGERILGEDEALTVTDVLRGVVEEGTASFFHNLDDELGRPSAGKTGTTDDFVDAWFVGYVPQLTTSVWVGYPGSSEPMRDVQGYEEINGENFPLDIWSAYMSEAVQAYPEEEFDSPSNTFNLNIKNDGNAVGGPPPPPSTDDDEESDENGDDNEDLFDLAGRLGGEEEDSDSQSSVPQQVSSPAAPGSQSSGPSNNPGSGNNFGGGGGGSGGGSGFSGSSNGNSGGGPGGGGPGSSGSSGSSGSGSGDSGSGGSGSGGSGSGGSGSANSQPSGDGGGQVLYFAPGSSTPTTEPEPGVNYDFVEP